MAFRMSGRTTKVRVVVIACHDLREVTYRHHYRWKGRERSADETYRLEVRRGGVVLSQHIDLSGAGIPWVFRPLIWFLDRFGKSQGKSSMEKVRDLVEAMDHEED